MVLIKKEAHMKKKQLPFHEANISRFHKRPTVSLKGPGLCPVPMLIIVVVDIAKAKLEMLHVATHAIYKNINGTVEHLVADKKK